MDSSVSGWGLMYEVMKLGGEISRLIDYKLIEKISVSASLIYLLYYHLLSLNLQSSGI
jgi:hypothetical protein